MSKWSITLSNNSLIRSLLISCCIPCIRYTKLPSHRGKSSNRKNGAKVAYYIFYIIQYNVDMLLDVRRVICFVVDVNYCSHRSPCLNGGSCINSGAGFRCLCEIGFNGTFCEHVQCTTCHNSGLCDASCRLELLTVYCLLNREKIYVDYDTVCLIFTVWTVCFVVIIYTVLMV